MIAFEVSLNGTALFRAGVADCGVVTAIARCVRREREQAHPETGEIYPKEELVLDVGGLAGGEHLRWPSQQLRQNDAITIRVIKTDSVDAPSSRFKEDAGLVEEAERREYEALKRKYEGTAA